MNLFEFLMILLSLIVGLGVAEILSGFGRFVRDRGIEGLSWIHAVLSLTILLALLQTFWESWGLREFESWTFPAMLLMLSSPVALLLIAHILYPANTSDTDLEDHYFGRARLLWLVACFTVIAGVMFRPLAFGMELFAVDNLSALPTLGICVLLSYSSVRKVHYVLAPLVLLAVLLDTLTISYSIA